MLKCASDDDLEQWEESENQDREDKEEQGILYCK